MIVVNRVRVLLALCFFILVASLFLKDVPLAKEFLPDQEEVEATESTEDTL